MFGANGPTGRLLTEQLLADGHPVAAATRRPVDFPISHTRLSVLDVDVHDPAAVDAVVAGSDAVLSAVGASFGKQTISVYSVGVTNIIASMRRHRVRRLAVVSSSAVAPNPHPPGGFVFNKILQPYVERIIGKTVYDDMRRMEALVRASGLDWTIVRPSGLYDAATVSDYVLTEGHGNGRFTSRRDLAASLAHQLTDDRFVGRTVAVISTGDHPSLIKLIMTESRKKG